LTCSVRQNLERKGAQRCGYVTARAAQSRPHRQDMSPPR
jgi:hypothetical protein